MSSQTLRSKITDLLPASSSETLRSKITDLMPQAKSDLKELVACRSVADEKQQPKEQCEMAADWIVKAFTDVGLQEMTRATTPDGSAAAGSVPTALIVTCGTSWPTLRTTRRSAPPSTMRMD